jgi:hypothetical protein
VTDYDALACRVTLDPGSRWTQRAVVAGLRAGLLLAAIERDLASLAVARGGTGCRGSRAGRLRDLRLAIRLAAAAAGRAL